MSLLPRAALAALVLSFAAIAAAAPCESCAPGAPGAPGAPVGWWDDRLVDPGHVADESPRIDVDGDGVTSRVAIAWERREGAGGDGDVVVAVSDDGGCSWRLTAVAPGPEDDRFPDVGVLLSRGLVAVTFVRDGGVVAAISADGGRTFGAPANAGGGAGLAPADAGSRPRLGLIGTALEAHLHVAWTEGGRVRVARNLASGTAAAWTSRTASDAFTGFSSWTSVDVAADTRSAAPGTESAVTLLASGLAPGSAVPEIFALRSNDSGAMFLGDPATPSTLDAPRRVSPARGTADPARGAADPRLDVSDDGSGEFWTWEAAAFTDLEDDAGGSGAGAVARGDARAEEGTAPSTLADWNDGAADDVALGSPGRAAAVAVIPNPLQRPPSPAAWFFFERDAEIFGARAVLDTAVPAWIAPTCAPMQVTGVAPPRATGTVAAESCAADEDLSHVFLAWADGRAGGSSIAWKRTDTTVYPATDVVAGPGDCATGGGLEVAWTPPPGCDVARVRIEWSASPGGRDGFVVVPPVSPAQVTGLPAGATLFVRVVVVDEACNEAASAETSGVAATCAATRPPNPVGPSLRAARRPTPDDVDLRWDAPPSDAAHDAATSYDVFRSIARADRGFTALSTAGPQPWVDLRGAAPGTPLLHFYLVVARNSAGTSGDEPLP